MYVREEKKGTTTPTPKFNVCGVYVFVNLLFVIDKRREEEKKEKLYIFFFYVVLLDLLIHAKEKHHILLDIVKMSTTR